MKILWSKPSAEGMRIMLCRTLEGKFVVAKANPLMFPDEFEPICYFVDFDKALNFYKGIKE